MRKFTIFGLAGTGTTSVGELLAKNFGYKFVSSWGKFRDKSNELGMELNEFEKLCLRDPKYDIELDRFIADFGRENINFVVESRLAYRFIPDSIKIKLVCDYSTRIQRVARRHSIPTSVASEKTNFRERMAERRYSKYYDIKKLAPDKKFQIIIDTSRISIEKIVGKIVGRFNMTANA